MWLVGPRTLGLLLFRRALVSLGATCFHTCFAIVAASICG
jgi:hypothetical protein